MRGPEFTDGRRSVDRTLTLQTPAKVNLHLEVLRQRHDGYHDIETVLQAVALFDRVKVRLGEERSEGSPGIDLTVTGVRRVPADRSNLAWQAAELFCRRTQVSGDLSIHLDKEIPAAAGLGGGSSNAAAVLVACNILFGNKLPPEELESMGAELGSDVPFFIRGGTAMARGRGTVLESLPTVRSGRFLIVKPRLELKTSDVYEALKMGLTVNSPKVTIQVIKSILARFPQRTWPGFNRLEEVVLPTHPELQRIVLQLRELAPVAMLSGSGSAAFAVFPDGHDLAALAGEFERGGHFVRAVDPHPVGATVLNT